mmetsp:Transcript_9787/g.18344  ORF Transcript_9787/g.18344 Transcript_9787/m.18344 type:complete len:531 (+) Transcript_9787:752-2344(+)|eukprot:CAMPEP_0203757856 /NCGR_PEP_ID=MMETSP0098-20131031/10723_1 /ASSEMBLY_ACC=CAM_ASM_000208 /TAXON_ID=96639 /ORGANISM=" , Strain NY0313808BC1" /LENGTH=530 /DNA_ID=CAMNT_0050650099 /DNA_START=149 /DNA_END=1741 /DNA_ORIENTATION=-
MDQVTGLCCVCGVSMKPNRVNTCHQCLQTENDITNLFSKNGVLLKCKGCERYSKSNDGWIYCAPESKALLALCLKKIKGLQNVSLVDANFIWTEAHSKRIKVKLTVQKEVANEVVLQQSCVVEFVVQGKMCTDCHLEEAKLTWNTIVQVRQKVLHKRTFLFLEQLILKHREDARTIKIEPMPEGVDFYFAAKNDAVRFVDFLDSVVPMRYKTAKKIISQDIKSNIAKFNHTYAVEIVPICKDDLVCLPLATARKLGNIPQIVLCLNVANVLRFINPQSCQVVDLSAERFWPRPFRSLMDSRRLVSFTVLDVELVEQDISKSTGKQQQENPRVGNKRRRKAKGTTANDEGLTVSAKHKLAHVEVAKDSDFGVNDTRYVVLSHLGHLLKPGDSVLGYEFSSVNANDSDIVDLKNIDNYPDIILVRKHYPKWRKYAKKRNWKLKTLVMNPGEGSQIKPGYGMATVGDRDEDRDRELFMRDLEEDEEMRSKVNLFKTEAGTNDHEDVEPDAPVIGIENLLDELDVSQKDDDEQA